MLWAIKIVGLCCLISCSLAAGSEQEPSAIIRVGRQDSIIRVNASINLPVTPCEAFSLLTDYDSLPRYVPGILETHYQRISTNKVKVWQTGEVGVLFFHVRMKSLLEMEEMPNRQITFRQLEGDLESYRGEWDFQEVQEGTRVTYISALTFRQYVPAFLARSVLENEIGRRFDAIFKEALARKSKIPFACAEEGR